MVVILPINMNCVVFVCCVMCVLINTIGVYCLWRVVRCLLL